MAVIAKRLTDSDYRSLAEFRHVLRRFLAFSEEAARKAGLASQQHQVLLAIKGFGGSLTVGDLAEKLVIKPHSAVGLVDRLVEAGLVRRSANSDDRRTVWLSLTPAAEKLLVSLSRSHREELRRLIPLLKPLLHAWDTEE